MTQLFFFLRKNKNPDLNCQQRYFSSFSVQSLLCPHFAVNFIFSSDISKSQDLSWGLNQNRTVLTLIKKIIYLPGLKWNTNNIQFIKWFSILENNSVWDSQWDRNDDCLLKLWELVCSRCFTRTITSSPSIIIDIALAIHEEVKYSVFVLLNIFLLF